MNLKEILGRLELKGRVDLSALYHSEKYPMSSVSRYWDPVTKNAIDVTAAVNGRRLYRQTSRPEASAGIASFEGSRWLEESV